MLNIISLSTFINLRFHRKAGEMSLTGTSHASEGSRQPLRCTVQQQPLVAAGSPSASSSDQLKRVAAHRKPDFSQVKLHFFLRLFRCQGGTVVLWICRQERSSSSSGFTATAEGCCSSENETKQPASWFKWPVMSCISKRHNTDIQGFTV